MSAPTEGAPRPSPGSGAPPAEAPFPVGRFFTSLVALAAAIVIGDYVLYGLLGADPVLVLAPRLLVILFFGVRLRSFRQVLGFGWGASLVAVAARFVEAQLDPHGPAAQGAAGGGPLFWVAGLVFWWSVSSLLYAAAAFAGHLLQRQRLGPSA